MGVTLDDMETRITRTHLTTRIRVLEECNQVLREEAHATMARVAENSAELVSLRNLLSSLEDKGKKQGS